jgi:hypothetical protein
MPALPAVRRSALFFVVASGLFILLAPCARAGDEPARPDNPPEGFIALFNGEDLDGWWGLGTEDPSQWQSLPENELAEKRRSSREDIRQHWTVEDGELVNDGKGLYLTTNKDYGDFELLVDYKTVAKADSGIYLRGIPQVQIWDYTKEGGKWDLGADKGSGGLWNNSPGAPGKDPLVLADKPFGQWNHFRILMVGERVTVYLNGALVVDHARLENLFNRKKTGFDKKPVPRRGPIELQTHGGEIRWRNVFLRPIGPEEANRILAEHGEKGFKSVFNGKNFNGWSGPIENYQVLDGAVVCKPGKGGTVYTKDEYGDFAARLEFKLPAGGNNGLAIRYPGSGDAAYSGMCELQVIDNTAAQYAKLDPRQYHGSVYGQIPAHRGYLRDVGKWNFQEVTVQGSRIRVELNGTVILDGDLAAVKELMYPIEKFTGRTRTRGHFGFAGHSDPVQFRKIRIKPLEEQTEKAG